MGEFLLLAHESHAGGLHNGCECDSSMARWELGLDLQCVPHMLNGGIDS